MKLNKYGLGCIRDKHDSRDLKCKISPPSELPDTVDMRMGFPPIWNQENQGSCTGHATAAAVHYVDWENDCFPIDGPRPAPRFIYYHARVLEGTVDQDSGASIRNAIKSINTYGVCSEDYCKYNPRNYLDKPSDEAISKALLHKSLSYKRVDQDLNSIKTVLTTFTPIVFGIAIFKSFQSSEVARTGIIPMPGNNEEVLGGHAIIAVGYSNSYEGVICRNSWGNWGISSSGYFILPYRYICDESLAFDFWAIDKMA